MGKVALISGGAPRTRGYEARLFVREGAKVVLRHPGRGRETGRGRDSRCRGEATYVHLDVTNEDSWRAAVDTAVRLYGQLNILVKQRRYLYPQAH